MNFLDKFNHCHHNPTCRSQYDYKYIVFIYLLASVYISAGFKDVVVSVFVFVGFSVCICCILCLYLVDSVFFYGFSVWIWSCSVCIWWFQHLYLFTSVFVLLGFNVVFWAFDVCTCWLHCLYLLPSGYVFG